MIFFCNVGTYAQYKCPYHFLTNGYDPEPFDLSVPVLLNVLTNIDSGSLTKICPFKTKAQIAFLGIIFLTLYIATLQTDDLHNILDWITAKNASLVWV